MSQLIGLAQTVSAVSAEMFQTAKGKRQTFIIISWWLKDVGLQ